MGSRSLKPWLFVAFWCAIICIDAGHYLGGGGGGYGHGHGGHDYFHVHLAQVNHTIKCGAKGGTCVFVDQCDTTTNIYKLGLCGFNYSVVCCMERSNVCNRNWGFCINSTSTCRASGNYYSWFGCNATHRCCRPYVKKLATQQRIHHGGHGGGYGHSHGGNYGGGHGGYGNSHGGYGGGGHGGNYNNYGGGSHGGYGQSHGYSNVGHAGAGHVGYGHGSYYAGGHGHYKKK